MCRGSHRAYCFLGSQALVVCLESKGYSQIRNTIMVLTKVSLPRIWIDINQAPGFLYLYGYLSSRVCVCACVRVNCKLSANTNNVQQLRSEEVFFVGCYFMQFKDCF